MTDSPDIPFSSALSCDAVLARLDEHLDGELPRELEAPFEAHLAGCAACLRQAEHQTRFLKRLRRHRHSDPASTKLWVRISSELMVVEE